MRLTSLDVFRGIAIAGMILVNTASLGKVYPFLSHADWNGCTLADLVFPFFLFIVGVAMSFSLAKYTKGKQTPASVYWRIFRRSIILFALGLLLNGFWNYDISNIRIMGVLQRIALAYLFTALAILKLPKKGLWVLTAILLVGYWAAMILIPVPNYGAGVLTREGNFGAWIDRLIIPTTHLYKGDGYNLMGDPEGLFSTLPAIATTLLGYLTGNWLRKQNPNPKTSINLALIGIICLFIGWNWGLLFPINKKLWTSSFVLFTSGWAMLLLAGCYQLIEVRELRRWGKPFEILGLNAIFIFVASVLGLKLMAKIQIGTGETAISIYNWIYQNLFASWAGEMNGSLLFALITLLFWWAVAYLMYAKNWFFKV
ncbi:acyltransferase family protein [Aerosakkonemataceae cyanobacterium BLCC-F154]|uniref:Acyltransferase family protein n=1 Tax=Floridaenema fluviatile BLCC-F154 TaxID=3153640 RepID=A0ABV4YB34_9CYAN